MIASFYLVVLISFCVSKIILRKAKTVHISNSPANRIPLCVFFFVPFGMLLLHYIAFYPGGFSADSVRQYTQAISGTYSDWHPFTHTFLTFTIPLFLTGGWIGSIVLFQIVVFSLALAYSLFTIQTYTNRKYALIAMLFFVLNPQTGSIVIIPYKDVAFAIGALLLTSFSIHVFMTNGKWLNTAFTTAAVIIVVALTTLFRHNAILFTAPSLLAMMLWTHRKKAATVCVAVLLLFAVVKGPVYSLVNVKAASQRQVETLGLPMTVIGAVVHDHPEVLSDEAEKFVYSVAPKEVWQEKYVYGDYNVVKRDPRTDNTVIEQYGASAVISIMVQCFKSAPRTAMRGLICLTDPIYSLTHLNYEYVFPYVTDNDIGIAGHGIESLQTAARYYGNAGKWFPHLFGCLGLIHLVILAVSLAYLRENRLKNRKAFLFALPVFCYNFGTMLLLTGSKDTRRFFYYTFLLFPLMLVFYLGRQESSNLTDTQTSEEPAASSH